MRRSAASPAAGIQVWAVRVTRRVAAALALTAGIIAVQLQLSGPAAVEPVRAMLLLAGRALPISWIIVTGGGALVGLLRHPKNAASASHHRSAPAWLVLAAGALLICAFNASTPWRLTSNLLGYAACGVPLAWLLARHAGSHAAIDFALAFCTFTLVPATLDTPRPPGTLDWEPASPYRWSVGLPYPEARIAHEVRFDRPLDESPMELLVWLAREQTGPARLVASLNGQPLGPLAEEDFNTRVVAIPRALSAGRSVLRFEIRATTVDPSLRLLAHPWHGGATAGRSASSFFDGARWVPGTFNDLTRLPQAGIYVVSVRGVWR